MINFIEKFLLSIGTFSLVACTGEVFFKQNECAEGEVRKGAVCVAIEEQESLIKTTKNCVDPDLGSLKKGTSLTLCDGSTGVGTFVPEVPSEVPTCVKDGDQDCIVKKNFKAVDVSNLDTSKITKGNIIAGITGTARVMKSCRNYSNLTGVLDSSYPPSNFGWNAITFGPGGINTGSDQITLPMLHGLVTNSALRLTTSGTMPAPLVANTTYYAIYVSTTVIQVASTPNGSAIDLTSQGTGTHTAHDVLDYTAQYFDTTEDFNNGSGASPSANPWSSSEYLCDATNFINVSSTAAPLKPSGLIASTANRSFSQIWQDQISGVYVSNILYDGGPNNRNWSDAIRTCESLNGAEAGDGWHVPTQKEIMQLYIHGISKLTLAGGSVNAWFWSSTSVSNLTNYAWRTQLATGYSYYDLRTTNFMSTICVR